MIPLIKNNFYNPETQKKASQFLATSDKLSMGDYVKRFEELFSLYEGRKHGVMVNSGSSANLILIQSLLNLGKLKKGDRVGISAITWITNVAPIIQLGLIPVPIDISINTLNVSSENLKDINIDCLFLTHALGFCDDIETIDLYCKQNNILLIIDSCECSGTIKNNKKISSYGLASTYSFFIGHHYSCIEGGMVLTDDKELNYMLIMTRAHGWKRNLDNFQDNNFYEKYTFYDLAYNVRPQELNGYLGCVQIDEFNKILAKRYSQYSQFFHKCFWQEDLIKLNYNYDCIPAFALPIICKTKEIKEKYLKIFQNKGIETRPIISQTITRQPFWNKYIKDKYDLPNADFISDCGFYVSNDASLTKEEFNVILECI